MGRLRHLVDVLTGRTDQQLVQALTGQLAATMEGARLAQSMVGRHSSRACAHARMGTVEHVGDTHRGRLVEVLSHSLATPVDREDLFRLSRSIDDVLDTLRDFVRESHLYRVRDQSCFAPMLEQIVDGISDLGLAVDDLVGSPAQVTSSALRAKKAGGLVCRMYQYEIAQLLSDEMSAETLKTRELLRRLEIVGTRLGDAADALADGAMKRWA